MSSCPHCAVPQELGGVGTDISWEVIKQSSRENKTPIWSSLGDHVTEPSLSASLCGMDARIHGAEGEEPSQATDYS